MKIFTSPWLIAVIFLGFFGFVETLHMVEHEHCRECPPCKQEY